MNEIVRIHFSLWKSTAWPNQQVMFMKHHVPLQGHPVSQSQGHKVVKVGAIWMCLTWGICRRSMDTVHCIKQKLADRCTDKTDAQTDRPVKIVLRLFDPWGGRYIHVDVLHCRTMSGVHVVVAVNFRCLRSRVRSSSYKGCMNLISVRPLAWRSATTGQHQPALTLSWREIPPQVWWREW